MEEELSLFYEDATEQLQIMESALLDVKDGTEDMDKIGEIFRAMHTIKGTAGMFEFNDIVKFTHVAESLLDEIRSGNIKLDAQLSSLFMTVKDLTENMVEYCINAQELPNELLDTTSTIKEQLNSFINFPNAIHDSATVNSEETSMDFEEQTSDSMWHISLRFDNEFFSSGMDIISIFRFFNKKGEIVINIPITQDIPTLDEIDCLVTYIGFEFDFQSECSYEEILEIFEFVEDDITLYVFKHDDKESWNNLFQTYEYLEKYLIEQGVYSPEDSIVAEKPQVIPKDEVEVFEPKLEESEVISFNKNESSVKVSENSKKSFSLRVDSSKVDLLINKMGEMVIQNAKLMQIAEQQENEDLEEVSSGITLLLEEVREAVMNIRMVQVKDTFVKFRRIVNDTAKKLGKDIDFVIEGGETELDKSVVEKLSDPLVHMLRNSIDHGIEMPDIRESKGKSKKGHVFLRAYPDSGSIIIEIEDDGAGIKKENVLKKAIENGVISAETHLNDKEVFKLIFEAGLSTAKEVSDISGRGVGMDVVKRNIEDLRGSIDVDSTEDRGSKISIRLPLTLAIIDGFLVQAGATKYIIPLDLISECIELTKEYQTQDGSSTINVRGDILPLLDVRHFYNEEINDSLRQNVVIVRYGNYKVGLQVDELFGEQQTVIKPLGDIFEHIPGISGGSILGTGEVALIFDIPRLLEYKIKQGV